MTISCDEAQAQIYQGYLEWKRQHPDSMAFNNDDMFVKFREALVKIEAIKSSRLHKNVSKVLHSELGLSIENEFVTNEGYTVDIKIGNLWMDLKTSEVKPLCIEVDGPSHFYQKSKRYTASTLMKHRHLRAFGFHVISIPYWEWIECKQDMKAKKVYLRSKVETRFREK